MANSKRMDETEKAEIQHDYVEDNSAAMVLNPTLEWVKEKILGIEDGFQGAINRIRETFEMMVEINLVVRRGQTMDGGLCEESEMTDLWWKDPPENSFAEKNCGRRLGKNVLRHPCLEHGKEKMSARDVCGSVKRSGVEVRLTGSGNEIGSKCWQWANVNPPAPLVEMAQMSLLKRTSRDRRGDRKTIGIVVDDGIRSRMGQPKSPRLNDLELKRRKRGSEDSETNEKLDKVNLGTFRNFLL